MFKKVLIATDLSEYSDSLISRMSGLKDLGIHDVILFYACGIKHLDEVAKLIRINAEPVLTKERQELESQGFKVHTVIEPGIPSLELKKIANTQGVSLIIINSPNESRIEHLISRFGGITSEILHTHETPLLLLRPRVNEESVQGSEILEQSLNEKVLFATDFSEISTHVQHYLNSIVSPTCRKITLLHVQDKTKIEKHLSHKLDEFNKIDQERLEKLRDDISQGSGTEMEVKIRYGIPAKEILDESKDGYSLIIMGSQGRGFFKEVFVGSVSHHVYLKANTSLLLIPAKTR